MGDDVTLRCPTCERVLGWRRLLSPVELEVALNSYKRFAQTVMSLTPPPDFLDRRHRLKAHILGVQAKSSGTIEVAGNPQAASMIEALRVRLRCKHCAYERVVTGERFHAQTLRAIELKLTSMSFD